VVHDGASQISLITKTTKNPGYCLILTAKHLISSVFTAAGTTKTREAGSGTFKCYSRGAINVTLFPFLC